MQKTSLSFPPSFALTIEGSFLAETGDILKMKRLKIFFVAVALTLVSGGAVCGGEIASHAVTFNFQEINEIDITGSPSLTINSAVAGEQPENAIDSSSICAITTNGANKRITASIDTAIPAYVTLKVNVAAPSGSGTSQGDVSLTTSASDVVTGISHLADSSLTITYKLSATVQAGVIPTDTRTVTFTLSD